MSRLVWVLALFSSFLSPLDYQVPTFQVPTFQDMASNAMPAVTISWALIQSASLMRSRNHWACGAAHFSVSTATCGVALPERERAMSCARHG